MLNWQLKVPFLCHLEFGTGNVRGTADFKTNLKFLYQNVESKYQTTSRQSSGST